MTILPENLILLHNGEEQLRIKSLSSVEAGADMLLHLHIV